MVFGLQCLVKSTTRVNKRKRLEGKFTIGSNSKRRAGAGRESESEGFVEWGLDEKTPATVKI